MQLCHKQRKKKTISYKLVGTSFARQVQWFHDQLYLLPFIGISPHVAMLNLSMWYFCMRSSGNLTFKSSKHVSIFSRCLYNHIQFFFFRFLGLTKMQVNVIFRKLSTSMDHNRSSMFICFNVTVKCLKCICFMSNFLTNPCRGPIFQPQYGLRPYFCLILLLQAFTQIPS